MISKILNMERIVICDLTENCVHAKLALNATEESQECQRQLFASLRQRPPEMLSLIPRQSRGLCEHFTYPKGPRVSDGFFLGKPKVIPAKNVYSGYKHLSTQPLVFESTLSAL